jgi:diamine N-acetyltransferase
MRIIEANTKEQLRTIEVLARRIVPDFYATYFDVAAAEWMVDNGHTVSVLEAQARKGYRHYLMNLESKPVGYFALSTEGVKLKLSHFYVLEEYRGKGFGQFAMDFIIREAAAAGAHHVELLVLRRNKATVAFYRKNGFFPVAEVLTRLGNGAVLEDYLMRKEIDR